MLLKSYKDITVSRIIEYAILKDLIVEFMYDDSSEFVKLNGFDKYSSEKSPALYPNRKLTIQINSVADNVSHFEKNCYQIYDIERTRDGIIYKGQCNFNNSTIKFKSKEELSDITVWKVINMRICYK